MRRSCQSIDSIEGRQIPNRIVGRGAFQHRARTVGVIAIQIRRPQIVHCLVEGSRNRAQTFSQQCIRGLQGKDSVSGRAAVQVVSSCGLRNDDLVYRLDSRLSRKNRLGRFELSTRIVGTVLNEVEARKPGTDRRLQNVFLPPNTSDVGDRRFYHGDGHFVGLEPVPLLARERNRANGDVVVLRIARRKLFSVVEPLIERWDHRVPIAAVGRVEQPADLNGPILVPGHQPSVVFGCQAQRLQRQRVGAGLRPVRPDADLELPNAPFIRDEVGHVGSEVPLPRSENAEWAPVRTPDANMNVDVILFRNERNERVGSEPHPVCVCIALRDRNPSGFADRHIALLDHVGRQRAWKRDPDGPASGQYAERNEDEEQSAAQGRGHVDRS